jgi:hypothetical protein
VQLQLPLRFLHAHGRLHGSFCAMHSDTSFTGGHVQLQLQPAGQPRGPGLSCSSASMAGSTAISLLLRPHNPQFLMRLDAMNLLRSSLRSRRGINW